MKSRIHFSATNFHENWAQRVLVSGCCNCNGRDILYPPLDRDGIRAQGDRYVHLIVVGMSRMGVAMGVTAAPSPTTPTSSHRVSARASPSSTPMRNGR